MVSIIIQSSGQNDEVMNMQWIKACQLARAVSNGDEAGVRGIFREWPATKTFTRYLDMALWRAASLDQKSSMQLLLAKGADMDSRFRDIPVLFAAATVPPACIGPDRKKVSLVQFL